MNGFRYANGWGPPRGMPFPGFPPPGFPPPPFMRPPIPFDPNERFAERERNLCSFLDSRRIPKKRSPEHGPSTVKFRAMLKKALDLSKTLSTYRKELSLKLDCGESDWKTKMDKVSVMKKELEALCTWLSSPKSQSALQKKLLRIANKRASKTRRRQQWLSLKVQEREELHRKIDRWLDQAKEKDLKLKRDSELKREADGVLSEVRRKILEAKRVNAFLQVLEKLRTGRQDHATQIGLEVSADHAVNFEDTIGSIRSCFSNQLEQYEGEERALQVMLAAEQEERREEEGKRRLHTAQAHLRSRQQAVLHALFGTQDLPAPGSPLFLFFQHHNSANCSIDSLLQIRSQWDALISEDGDTVPKQWVPPVIPSSASWEGALD